jgi:hypothetical protein
VPRLLKRPHLPEKDPHPVQEVHVPAWGSTTAPLHWRVGRRGRAPGRARRPERARPRAVIRARIVTFREAAGGEKGHGYALAGSIKARPADHASLHFDPPLSMAQPDNGPAHGAFQEARWPAARRSAGGEARPHGEAAPRPRCADTNTSTTQRVKSARGSSVPRGAVLGEPGTGPFPSRPGTVLAIAN